MSRSTFLVVAQVVLLYTFLNLLFYPDFTTLAPDQKLKGPFTIIQTF